MIRTIPSQIIAPVITASSDTSIKVSWSALTSPNNGNANITGYELLWDNGSGNVPSISLVNALKTSYTVPSNMITAGATYQFAVIASNVYGSATLISPVTSASAIYFPGKVPIPTVTIGVDATVVVIQWSGSTLTHGSNIDSYHVMFRNSLGTFVSEPSCNPAANTDQFTNLQCQVSMTNIISLTGLSLNAPIRAKVRAHNAVGWGDWSEINTSGATIEGVPSVVTTASSDMTALTNNQVRLIWTPPSSTGGTAVSITGYVVYWDLGTGAAWTQLQQTTDAFLLVNSPTLTGGQTYSFKVVAMNKYG